MEISGECVSTGFKTDRYVIIIHHYITFVKLFYFLKRPPAAILPRAVLLLSAHLEILTLDELEELRLGQRF